MLQTAHGVANTIYVLPGHRAKAATTVFPILLLLTLFGKKPKYELKICLNKISSI